MLSNSLLLAGGPAYSKCSCNTVVDDYKAFYPLCSNSNDCTGTYNGTDYGDVSYDGTKASFDGTGDYIDAIDVPLTISGGYAISFWYAKKTNSILQIPVDYDGGYNYVASFNTSGNLTFKASPLSSDANYARISHGLGDTFTGLHHFVINRTGTGNSLEIFVDGVSKTITYSGTILSVDVTIGMLGDRHLDDTFAINGDMAYVRIYDRYLTSTEVSDIYNHELSFV